jgi:hypothetical protein
LRDRAVARFVTAFGRRPPAVSNRATRSHSDCRSPLILIVAAQTSEFAKESLCYATGGRCHACRTCPQDQPVVARTRPISPNLWLDPRGFRHQTRPASQQ